MDDVHRLCLMFSWYLKISSLQDESNNQFRGANINVLRESGSDAAGAFPVILMPIPDHDFDSVKVVIPMKILTTQE